MNLQRTLALPSSESSCSQQFVLAGDGWGPTKHMKTALSVQNTEIAEVGGSKIWIHAARRWLQDLDSLSYVAPEDHARRGWIL